MMTNEAQIYFALDGQGTDPDLITNLMGVAPTKTWRNGDTHYGRVRENSSWQISTEKVTDTADDILDIYELSKTLLPVLKKTKENIIKAIDQFKLVPRFQLVIWISTDEKHSTPVFGFDADLIKVLGEIGATIDVDSYRN